ncbi:N-acetylglucosamine-6-phosphate deacetylase [Vallitalea longa]|uniref:N-acetylglucosamine-6-phosphate deacetylase n=1 Tax=Vallitalea longa TaxID=2936439 RepID=A0A9W5YE74_9FIRM|nr:N-acetylglucosamine-6-phosphate deacetylase [Vallitalea longa]GKX31887.1 N-acetylglucosamine-6-phosphate deacetylase [Vallitalea longa]
MIIKNGKVLVDSEFSLRDVVIKDSKICGYNLDGLMDNQVIDAEGMYVLPGFIDVHTHGGNGIDTNLADKEELNKLSEFFATKGVTGYLPTILTDTHERTCEIVEMVGNTIKEQKEGSKILGIHMEGPFLSHEFKGAMPDDLIVDCSLEKLMEYEVRSNNNIKTITVAAENTGVQELIRYAVAKGIIVSLGHSGATYEDCMMCIEEGANRITHTFNGMRQLHQHQPSILGAALESDVYCEAICDGLHLHPGIVRLMIKTKGIDRVIGITDSVMAAGLPDGKYKLGVNDIVVINGDARLVHGDSRAGSTLTMDKALKNIMEFTRLPLEESIKMLTINPAKMLKIDRNKGSLDIDKDADIVIMDKDMNVIYTIVEGKIVYNNNLID